MLNRKSNEKLKSKLLVEKKNALKYWNVKLTYNFLVNPSVHFAVYVIIIIIVVFIFEV